MLVHASKHIARLELESSISGKAAINLFYKFKKGIESFLSVLFIPMAWHLLCQPPSIPTSIGAVNLGAKFCRIPAFTPRTGNEHLFPSRHDMQNFNCTYGLFAFLSTMKTMLHKIIQIIMLKSWQTNLW